MSTGARLVRAVGALVWLAACGGQSARNAGPGAGGAPAAPTGGSAGQGAPISRVCESVTFADPVLETAVRGALQVPSGPVPGERMAELEYLFVSNTGSFRGIECAFGLHTLYANLGWALEAEPLAALVELETLSLSRHSFYSLWPLANLTALKSLNLNESLGLAGLEPIGTLTGLVELDVSFNYEADLHAIAPLTGLETLRIESTWAGNYGQPAELRGVGALSGMTRLTILQADSAHIDDLSPLSGLTSLEHLELGNNAITDLSPLAGASELTFLDARYNLVTSTLPLASLTGLTTLSLDHNPVVDLGGLAALQNLGSLSLRDSAVSDLTPLGSLEGLGMVALERSQVTDLSPLLANERERDDCPNLYLGGSPLGTDSLERVIPRLCELGWRVTWDEDGVPEYCEREACTPLKPK